MNQIQIANQSRKSEIEFGYDHVNEGKNDTKTTTPRVIYPGC